MSSQDPSPALQQALDRLERGRTVEADLETLRRAVQAGQIVLATGRRAVAFGADATDTVVVTGDYNHVVAVFEGAEADTLQWLLGDIRRSRRRRWLVRGIALMTVISVFGIFVLQIPSLLKDYVLPALAPPPQVEIVLDVSQRMRTEMDQPGQSKFDIARDAILEVLDTWEGSGVEVSLRLLGRSGGTKACEVVPSLTLSVDFTRDYDTIREKLRNLKPYGPEGPDAPLADTLQNSVQHLAEGGSPSQTIMVFTGGDDTCGKPVQVILNALAKRSVPGKAINSLTYLIVLATEKVGFTGVPGQEISVALAQTAREVKEEAQVASQSLPPTPTPQGIAKMVDSIANRVPDTPTLTPTSTAVALETPTARPTPTAMPTSTTTPPFIAHALPTSAPVPKTNAPAISTPGAVATPQPPPSSTPTYSPAPSAMQTAPAAVASEIPTTALSATATSTWTPTATASSTSTPTATPTATQTPVPSTYTATSTATATPSPTVPPTPTPSVTPTPTAPPLTSRTLPSQNQVYTQNCPLIAQTSGFNEFESNQATISSSLVSEGHSGQGLRLDFRVLGIPYSYSGWEAVLGDSASGVDLTSYTSLRFYIRGVQGGETPNVWLMTPAEGESFRRYYRDVEAYKAVTTQWQEIIIPLADFTTGALPAEQIDLRHINKIQVVFEWYEQQASGTVYIDDLCVVP